MTKLVTVLILYLSFPFLSISATNSVSTTRDQKGNDSPVSSTKCTNEYNYTNLESQLGEIKAQLNQLQDKIDDLSKAVKPGRDKRGSEANPGQSCKEIRNSEDFTTSGIYWFKPEGSYSKFQAYCDMSAIGQWKKVRLDQIDSTMTGGVTLTYTEQNGGLTISVRVELNGCGSTPEPGALTYVKGYWTKIMYTEEFKGTASCWSIFGDDWYGRSSVNHAEIGVHKFSRSQGDVITNQYYMGGDSHTFDGKVRRCDNDQVKNFWRNANPSKRHATVVLRRKLHAEKAGIFTGTSCGKPSFKINDIFVYY